MQVGYNATDQPIQNKLRGSTLLNNCKVRAIKLHGGRVQLWGKVT